MNPLNRVLFSSDLWKPALEKYAGVTHTTVKLFDINLRTVFGPIHPTPLFQMFEETGFDPGIFAECANRCLGQTQNRPAVVVSQVHGLAVVGTSLVLEGKIVGAAVAGYVLVDFSQVSEIRGIAHEAGIGFERLWQVAREQKPVPQSRLIINGELLQVLGDALLRENARTRQYEEIVAVLEETAKAKDEVHQANENLNRAVSESEERYRALFEMGPVAVYSCDASGVIDNFNRRATELWGRTPTHGDTDERFCGSLKLFRPDGSFMPHAQCPMAEVVTGKISEVRDAEVLIERPDGSRITVVVNIRPLMGGHGEVTGAINCFYDISGRKLAEEALRESERRFREMIDALPAAVYTTDAEGRLTHFNPAAVELSGRIPELGTDQWCVSWKMFRPDGNPLPHDECPMALGLKEGRIVRGAEAILERPDGKRFWFEPYPTPLHDPLGKIVGGINMLVDITERKRAQVLVDSQRQALQLLAQGAPLEDVLAFLISLVEADSAQGMLASIVPLNESGTHFERGIGPSLPDAFNAAVEGVAVSSPTGLCAMALRRGQAVAVHDFNADAAWRPFGEFVAPYGLRSGWSVPIPSSTGKMLATFANYYRDARDPTARNGELVDMVVRTAAIAIEQKRAEGARTRLAAIVESSADAIIGKDLNGIITTWNRGAERLFGYTEQEAIGQPITILIPADRLNEEPGILDAIRRGKRIEHYETVRRHKDGTLLEISLTVSPIVDDNGKIVGASKIARDITLRKQAEAVLKQSHEDLECIVEERTADLRKLSSNLLCAQDDERRRISRELHDSVGQYLAHAQMSLVALKRPGATDKEAQALLELTDDLDRCVSETRTISYLLHPPLLDEVGFASAARWYVEGFSKRSNIQVDLKIPEGLKRLPGELELVLFRILQESLTNIHRHSQTESVDIHLQLVADGVVLRVRDYGQGMPAELLNRFRAGTSVGVGLRSMRERIRELGGRFEIESDTSGTLIRVIAPLPEGATQSKISVGKASGT